MNSAVYFSVHGCERLTKELLEKMLQRKGHSRASEAASRIKGDCRCASSVIQYQIDDLRTSKDVLDAVVTGLNNLALFIASLEDLNATKQLVASGESMWASEQFIERIRQSDEVLYGWMEQATLLARSGENPFPVIGDIYRVFLDAGRKSKVEVDQLFEELFEEVAVAAGTRNVFTLM